MKALVYKSPGVKELITVPKPELLQPTDAVIKLLATTICGTDLHIIKGDVPACKSGTILGHEGIGIVEKVGSEVHDIKLNDKVLISCVTACGGCVYCKKGLESHCVDGGWILGHLIDGTQAEYVRIPHADNSLYSIKHLENKVPDESVLMLSDILPTGNEIGALSGKIQEGDIVAIVGSGSVGISALIAAKTFKPSKVIMIDFDEERLKAAKENFGADVTINPGKSNVKEEIGKVCNDVNVQSRSSLDYGVDVAIECVGIPQTFQTCQDIIAPGGRIANVGVHGTKVDLQLQDLWIKNINISTGLVNANSTPDLLKKVEHKVLDPRSLVTHHFKFNDIMKAYDVFSNSSKEKCIKVYLSFD
jgi:alcohol dehydrogenase